MEGAIIDVFPNAKICPKGRQQQNAAFYNRMDGWMDEKINQIKYKFSEN